MMTSSSLNIAKMTRQGDYVIFLHLPIKGKKLEDFLGNIDQEIFRTFRVILIFYTKVSFRWKGLECFAEGIGGLSKARVSEGETPTYR